MVGALLMKSSQLLLRPELFNLSTSPAPAKSLYLPSARVCFRRINNNNYTSTTLLPSSGVNHIFSAPHHKLDNFIFSKSNFITSSPPHRHSLPELCCSSSLENEISPFIVNNHHSVITVPNKIDEIKNKVSKLLASLLLFGFLAFITTPGSASNAAAASYRTASSASSTSSSLTSSTTPNMPSHTPSSSSTTTKFKIILPSPLAETVEAILLVTLFLFTIPLTVAIITGFKYFLQLCKSDKNSVLMLQLGVLDKTQNLQRVLAQIADASNSDSFKFKEVVNEVLQRYASCHFAHLSATKCLSDEEKKYWDIFVEMMRSICVDPPALFQAYFVFTFYIKSLAIFIHGALKAIKKIKYGDKCSKQLFREVLTRELERYDRGGETLTFANVDGVKCEKEAVGITHSMVDNGYTVVTILVLASGVYSIPPLVGSTEHVKNVLQKFNTIPKSEIETLEVLQATHTEDQGLSAQEVQKKFPLLKPLYWSGLQI